VDHDPKALQAAMEAASRDLELQFRPMFGGIFAYASGQAFASLSNVGLALKMTGKEHAALSAEPGVRPLRYEPDDPPSKTYLLMPDTIVSDPVLLGEWMARSAAGLKPKARKPGKAA
jgi:TfoX/Sxy family transcriptional regulator of competence genes